jgi:hypothetical protein
MAKDTRSLLVTKCPTYGTWFIAFIWGCHKCMRDIVKPDGALSLEVLHYIMNLVENDWERVWPQARFKYAREVCFYLIAFCGALRGEEVLMADLFGMLKHWEAGETHQTQTPHVTSSYDQEWVAGEKMDR